MTSTTKILVRVRELLDTHGWHPEAAQGRLDLAAAIEQAAEELTAGKPGLKDIHVNEAIAVIKTIIKASHTDMYPPPSIREWQAVNNEAAIFSALKRATVRQRCQDRWDTSRVRHKLGVQEWTNPSE